GAIPEVASQRLADAYNIMYIFTIAAIPVFALVVSFVGYAIFAFRSQGRPTEDGAAFSGAPRVQIAWILISIALAAFLYVVGFQGLAEIQASPQSNAIVVNVTGEQWLWNYNYPQYKNAGSTTLELPVNHQILFRIHSIDVQHSFWIPELGVKEDAVPGEINEITVTADKTGTFQVRCAELCGIYHAYMNTPVEVVSMGDFTSWVTSQPPSLTQPSSFVLPSQSQPVALVGVGKHS
ncbi:MAG TPA: cytochrome c oxidase subunit II, partial [Ktedonobacterales bacterium]|nr:cytochrome c oxidase subunit II [Ktedonobacterales bacterium]